MLLPVTSQAVVLVQGDGDFGIDRAQPDAGDGAKKPIVGAGFHDQSPDQLIGVCLFKLRLQSDQEAALVFVGSRIFTRPRLCQCRGSGIGEPQTTNDSDHQCVDRSLRANCQGMDSQ